MIVNKIVQTLIILLFALLVSDLRRKNQTKTLLNRTLLVFMKVIYLTPLLIFLVSVIRSKAFLVSYFLSLFFTLLGLVIVMVPKISLGANHSWTGYETFPKEFISNGLYSKIRYPMYTGIFICIFGMWFHFFWHTTLWFAIINFICSLFIFYVLISSAQKETQHLLLLFGNDYQQYINNVHPFLPLKKPWARKADSTTSN